MAGGLRSLAQAARGVAALTSDPAVQAIVLDTASDVLDKASSLIEEAKKATSHPGDPENQQRLAQVSIGERLLPPSSPDPMRKPTPMGKASSTLTKGQLLGSALEIWTLPFLSILAQVSQSG